MSAGEASPPERMAYSVADACKALSIGKTSVYNLINEGKLRSRKVGARTLISASSLRSFIEGEAA